ICEVRQGTGIVRATLELEGGPATPEMRVPVTFSNPEIVDGPVGFYFFGGETFRESGWSVYRDVVNIEVTMTATWKSSTLSCTVVVPGYPATATPTISPDSIESMACRFGGEPGVDRLIVVDLTLTEPAAADTLIRVTTNRLDIVIMPKGGALWAEIPAG